MTISSVILDTLAWTGLPAICLVTLVLFFSIALLRRAVAFISYDNVRIQTRFGEIVKVMEAGIHPMIPFVDEFATRLWHPPYITPANGQPNNTRPVKYIDIPINEMRHDPPSSQYYTKTSQLVNIDLNFYSKITDAKKAIQCCDLWDGLETVVNTAINNICQRYIDETEIKANLAANLDNNSDVGAYCEKYGIEITRVEVQDVSPNQEIIEARRKTAERVREAELATAQSKAKTDTDEQILKNEAKLAALRATQKEIDQQSANKIRVLTGQHESAFILSNMEHKLREQEASAKYEKAKWIMHLDEQESKAQAMRSIAKAEADAIELKAGAAMKPLLTHISDLPAEHQASILNTLHLTEVLKSNPSIKTVNLVSPNGVYYPSFAHHSQFNAPPMTIGSPFYYYGAGGVSGGAGGGGGGAAVATAAKVQLGDALDAKASN
jgi:regulator of protease activity HflC (stomatin/prohibitin superfamily)